MRFFVLLSVIVLCVSAGRLHPKWCSLISKICKDFEKHPSPPKLISHIECTQEGLQLKNHSYTYHRWSFGHLLNNLRKFFQVVLNVQSVNRQTVSSLVTHGRMVLSQSVLNHEKFMDEMGLCYLLEGYINVQRKDMKLSAITQVS